MQRYSLSMALPSKLSIPCAPKKWACTNPYVAYTNLCVPRTDFSMAYTELYVAYSASSAFVPSFRSAPSGIASIACGMCRS